MFSSRRPRSSVIAQLDEAARVLALAQQTADAAISEAQRQAAEIIAAAKREADEIRARARAETGGGSPG